MQARNEPGTVAPVSRQYEQHIHQPGIQTLAATAPALPLCACGGGGGGTAGWIDFTIDFDQRQLPTLTRPRLPTRGF